MNFFQSYTYTWWQIGIFKLALLAIGILIGRQWSDFFKEYLSVLIAVAVIATIYIVSISIKQINN